MRHFHEQLQDVLKQITIMGALTESMITLAMRVLVERDESLIDLVMQKENEVNALQVRIDETAVGRGQTVQRQLEHAGVIQKGRVKRKGRGRHGGSSLTE